MALPRSDPARQAQLRLRRIGIDSRSDAIVYMRRDCHVCRSEGFGPHTRVELHAGARSIIATLNLVDGDLLEQGEAGLSEIAWAQLGANEGQGVTVRHPAPPDSLSRVRAKVFGQRLTAGEMRSIIRDAVAGRYSDIQLASFVTACAARPLSRAEIAGLTAAMISAGKRIRWEREPVLDKHCIGGLPGNRTSPIVVAIAASCGLLIPKTSSRAITSPAGSADVMETLAPVDLDLAAMRRVVEREGGCLVWGGRLGLSPADETLIRVERALDLDSEGQLVASVLSKKVAAGAGFAVIDVPVGETTKVRRQEDALSLRETMREVGEHFGLELEVIFSDGSQPVGRGIGPALEAHDVLAVLQCRAEAPPDLRDKAAELAGILLEHAGKAEAGRGAERARQEIESGRAWSKFQAICKAQGGMREPGHAAHRMPVAAPHAGVVARFDNRILAKAAKLAGAPDARAAGALLHVRLGDRVAAGEPLYTLHAETTGELAYALDFVSAHAPAIEVRDA
jgi:thymidine phosphorylase